MGNIFNPLDHPICLHRPLRLTPFSTWQEHIPFAMCLVDLLRPNVIVELGTQGGDSYCAFCQAVKELGLSTRCYAVDTWKGDPDAGYYGPEVLADLRAHHEPLYDVHWFRPRLTRPCRWSLTHQSTFSTLTGTTSARR